VGLFGFKETRTTAGIVAGVIEIAAAAALGMLALTPAPGAVGRHEAVSGIGARLRAGVPWAGLLVTGVSVLALVVLGGSVAAVNTGGGAAASGGSGASASTVGTMKIGNVTVLTNAKGLTLYWFAPDKPGKSVCYNSCAAYWPPVKGPVTVAAGVTGVAGKLGTTRRTDGSLQATYNGRPLYTYIADTAPGQAKGNKLNLSGGLWYEATVP
jgi:predicted lipoprotein with Yx(FWY)xxD motif